VFIPSQTNASGLTRDKQPSRRFWKLITVGALCIATLALASSLFPRDSTSSKLVNLNIELLDLESKLREEIWQNYDRITDCDNKLRRLEVLEYRLSEVEENLDRLDYTAVLLDVTQKRFARIDSKSGSFFVAIDTVEPCLDGYKVKMKVGNPMGATFEGFSMRVTWGPAEPELHKVEEPPDSKDVKAAKEYNNKLRENTRKAYFWVHNLLRKKEFKFADTLRSGYWTPVEFIITPAKPEQIKYFSIDQFETPIVSLTMPGE
jgi:hypothetical protein